MKPEKTTLRIQPHSMRFSQTFAESLIKFLTDKDDISSD
jgi:hypothetical protein